MDSKKSSKKKCPKGKVMNPTSQRCVKADGKIGKSLTKAKTTSTSKKSNTRTSDKSTSNIVSSVLPILKLQTHARLRINYGKKVTSGWYDTELNVKYKKGAYYAKLFKEDKWHHVSKDGFTEKELLAHIATIKCKLIVLTVDKLNPTNAPLIIWRFS